MTLQPQRRAELFADAFAKSEFRGLPPHAAVYGDAQRLSEIYSVRFSLKKGALRLVWDPQMPPTQEHLSELASVYLDARDSFLNYASDRIGLRLVALTASELLAVLRMHAEGLSTPTFIVGSDIAVVDPLNLHRGPMLFVAQEQDEGKAE